MRLRASIEYLTAGWMLPNLNKRKLELILYIISIALIVSKVLWGYWERDLTAGDTSSYFQEAVRWHLKGQVNIVWSPLYTAYYGSWLSISENANVATFLHRLGLILISTGLIAWLGFITLPRFLALIFVTWWIALPIHYDTLYEVHLFGALPIICMFIICFIANNRWRAPALLGVALIATFLIRNEYILITVILAAYFISSLFRKHFTVGSFNVRSVAIGYCIALLIGGLLIAYFYSISYIQGSEIKKVSAPKHTLNMCQVYAFGYQQRHSDWVGDPWTGCSDLMKKSFGVEYPSLSEMFISKPDLVIEHFLWNLSLTRAGLEVLLFNATSSTQNPDYARVIIVPIIPSLLLGITFAICIAGVIVLKSNKFSAKNIKAREKLAQISPLLIPVAIMTIAVILTQRPRPSYLLGVGVLYMWFFLLMISVLFEQFNKGHSLMATGIFLILFLSIMPSYKDLPLPSKNGILGKIYNSIRPHAKALCETEYRLAVNEYGVNIVSYLCSPYFPRPIWEGKSLVNIGSLPHRALSSPEMFVDGLLDEQVGAIIVDPYLVKKYPSLRGCQEIRDAFLKKGWNELFYSVEVDDLCMATYVK